MSQRSYSIHETKELISAAQKPEKQIEIIKKSQKLPVFQPLSNRNCVLFCSTSVCVCWNKCTITQLAAQESRKRSQERLDFEKYLICSAKRLTYSNCTGRYSQENISEDSQSSWHVCQKSPGLAWYWLVDVKQVQLSFTSRYRKIRLVS